MLVFQDKSPTEARGIYRFDFKQPDKNATKVPFIGPLQSEDLVPYGISLWTDEDTGETLKLKNCVFGCGVWKQGVCWRC